MLRGLTYSAIGIGTLLVSSAVAEPQPVGGAAQLSTVKAHGQLGPGEGTLMVMLKPPAGAKLSAGAPYKLSGRGNGIAFKTVKGKLDPNEPTLKLPVVVSEHAEDAAEVDLKFSWCSHDRCVREKAKVSVTLDLTGDAPGGEAFFTYRAEAK